MDSDPQPNLWRSAEWWIAQILTVFGEPAHIALGLAPRVHVLLRRWLAGVEEFVRRLIIAEALVLPAPPPGPKLSITRKTPPARISFTFWRRPRLRKPRRTPRTLSTRPRSTRWDPWRTETPDTRPDLPRGYRPEPGGWLEPPPPAPRPRATPEQRRPFGHAPTWPMPSAEQTQVRAIVPAAGLSRRVEALIRVIAKPAACARRLAARLARSAALRLHLIHPPPDPGPLTPARDDIAAAQKEIERKLRPPDSS